MRGSRSSAAASNLGSSRPERRKSSTPTGSGRCRRALGPLEERGELSLPSGLSRFNSLTLDHTGILADFHLVLTPLTSRTGAKEPGVPDGLPQGGPVNSDNAHMVSTKSASLCSNPDLSLTVQAAGHTADAAD